MADCRAPRNFAGPAVTARRNSAAARCRDAKRKQRIAALGAALPSPGKLAGMDYRKIGQALQAGSGCPPSLRAPDAVRDLGQRPLDELGLAGLVERLALAIRRADRSC